jgi:polyisoprenoid-binding protein YceI
MGAGAGADQRPLRRRNFGVATVRGQIPVTAAWVSLDAAGKPAAVHAGPGPTGIATGHRRRDRDLRKSRLPGTAHHHPALTFDGPGNRTDDNRTDVLATTTEP